MPFDFKLFLSEQEIPLFEEPLQEHAGAVLTRLLESGPHKGLWELQAIFEEEPDKEKIRHLLADCAKTAHIKEPTLHIHKMPDINWLEASYQGFPPIEVGPYYIYGSHIQTPPPNDKISLKINAATAFGTGEHQTTHGCLKALSELTDTPHSVLDVGCGSGILAMAFAKAYHKPVDAVDIDSESVRVATENVHQNKLDKYITVWESNGYQKIKKQYDLIFCNILAKPLIEMAPDLEKHLNQGGKAILSGFLNNQSNWVKKAHEAVGLTLHKTYRVNGWTTLVMEKK